MVKKKFGCVSSPKCSEAQRELPDAVTEDILLRLSDAADVARASLVSTSFRRVASDSRFLRRYRSLHPPPLLGFFKFMGEGEFNRAEPPNRSAPAARAVEEASDFTFSFLPGGSNPGSSSWCVRDARHGRVLLSRHGADASSAFLDLVVCDPLHRRYVQIPPIPSDLVPPTGYSAEMVSEPFLAPADEVKKKVAEEEDYYLHYRVIYNWMSQFKVLSFIFTSDTGTWRGTTSMSLLPHRLIQDPTRLVRHYVRGCFYWARHRVNYMLVLDLRAMKFSVVELPHDNTLEGLAIADGGEDRLCLLSLYRRTINLYSKTQQKDGGAEEWRHDNVITLPEHNYRYRIIATDEGYSLLNGTSGYLHQEIRKEYFTLDLKTLHVERLCAHGLDHDILRQPIWIACLYASFPPTMSPPKFVKCTHEA